LFSVSSDGRIIWDYDAVCEEAEKSFDAYSDLYGKMYLEASYNNDSHCYALEKEETETVIRNWLRKCTGRRYIPGMVVEVAITALKDLAREEEVELFHRMRKHRSEVLYALGQNEKVVRITPNKVELIDYPRKLFVFDTTGDEKQVEPDLTVNPVELKAMMRPLFNIQNERDWILLLTFIGCSLFSSASSPIFFIEGEKGSSKSTTSKWMQRIVSPKRAELYKFPKTEQDLGIMLSQEAFLTFDNMGGIRNDIADLLCQAVTGGYVKTRKLFTDDETVTRSVKTMLVLNGVSYLSQREDLTDRVLMIRQKRVYDAARATDDELEAKFEELRPKILGGFFNAVAQAMAMENIQCLQTKIRTLDYEVCAIKIGIALGFTQEEVENAFKENRDVLIKDMIEENPLTNLIVTLLQNRESISYTATELYDKLHKMYEGKQKVLLPGSPSMVSRKLGQVRSDLANLGITFELDNSNGKKQIFFNDGTYVPNCLKKSKEHVLTQGERSERLKKLAEPDNDDN